MGRWAPFLMIPFLIGCVSHPRVRNPLPGVFRVAVIPFNDKTAGDEAVDTMAFTKVFTAELQKIPSYEVVPLQEVLEVLGPNTPIETNQPALAYAVARAVHAQAVIVGDITEYKVYYPPRVGLHCEMYAMVLGEPEAIVKNPAPQPVGPQDFPDWLHRLLGPIDHFLHGKHQHGHGKKCAHCGGKGHLFKKFQKVNCPNCGGQGSINEPGSGESAPADNGKKADQTDGNIKKTSASVPADPTKGQPTLGDPSKPLIEMKPGESSMAPGRPSVTQRQVAKVDTFDYRVAAVPLERPIPVVEPWVIRHSRIFDGNNLGLGRKLRQYYFFKSDQRGGDWVGYTHRMDDFNRFAADRMIYEMLESAGGQWRVERGLSVPKFWEPWPWR